jgi:hypothetical protein
LLSIHGSKNSGFTISEIVIAIFIIIILSIIALPAYRSYTQQARISEINNRLEVAFDTQTQLEQAYESNLGILRTDLRKVLEKRKKDRLVGGIELHSGEPFIADLLYDLLPKAFAYLGAPPSMNIDDAERIYLALNAERDLDVSSIVPSLVNGSPAEVRVADRVKASLSSADFDVVPESPAIQAMRRDALLKWSWVIKPKKEGVGNISVTLSALVDVNERETPLVLKTYEREIEVDVTTPQVWWRFMKENLPWLWAPLAAIAAGIWAAVAWLSGRSEKG